MFRLLLVSLLVLYCLPVYAGVQINLTSPADGARFTEPASITVSSIARAIYDGEVITAHRLYRDGVEIASGTTGTLSTTITLAAGTYQFQSGANSNQGGGAASEVHTITVVEPGGNPPTVTLGTPTGAPFIAPATVGLSATAADSDGTITKVEFFANGGLIGTDTVAPYQIGWGNVAVGSHSLTARATDNNGIATTSAPKTLTVAASTVKGHIDGVSLNSAGTYEVIGWACSTGRDGSIPVHMYAGGAAGTGIFVGQFSANQASEAGVAAACQAQGTHYRFRIALTDAMRQQHANRKIYIHGIGEGPNLLLSRSGVFAFPAPMMLVRKYVYRPTDQSLCKVIEPEAGATVTIYDGANNLIWSASGLDLPDTTRCNGGPLSHDSGRRVDRTYDARNRLMSVVFPDHRGDTTYHYTPDSLLASVTADNGGANQVTTQYTYNRRRLMTHERMLWSNAGINWPINYAYNANGHLSATNWHGLTIDYAPNALGQPTQAGSFADNVSYYPNGAIKQFTYGNGIVHTMTQNVRQLPERSRDVYGSTVFLDDSYDYDKNGNIAGISDALPGHRGDRTMTYDDLDRLMHVTSPMFSGGATYRYDALDNLTRVVAPGRNHFYCYDGNWRLTNVKSGPCDTGATVIGLGYDVQGNLANKNGQVFDFDYGNRLRSVSGSLASSYVYDGHGRRVRDHAGSSKYSQYSHAGQLTMTGDNRAGTVIEYIHLQGSLVAIRERKVSTGVYTTKYQHTDALGSPVAVTSQARTVLERREYEPYGRQLRPTAPVDGPGFTGHVLDAATGLNYMEQRYYDPMIGRFLSVDPVTAYGGDTRYFNRYWYAAGNPYKYTDPDGRVLDTIADIGFIAYSGYKLATEPSWTNAAALGADVVGAVVPFATGLGAGVRAAAHGADAAKAADGAADAAKPLMGRNPQPGSSRTNTDLGPNGDRASAKSVFRNQAEGKKTTTPMANGGTRTRAENGVQIRHNPDGSSRVDLPNRGSAPNGESIHTPPPPPPPPPPPRIER